MDEKNFNLLHSLIQRYLPGVRTLAFGSRVTGKAKRYSDIDLVAFTSPGQTDQVNLLREAFEDSDLPFRVDFFEWDRIPATWKAGIESVGVAL
jgi:predicted nucleotidyltransferase